MRLRTATVLLAALGLLTTACSDNKKPQTLPSLTPTPTATAAPVAIPSAATPATAQGADAFVRFFFTQLNAAFSDSNAGLLSGLIDPACGTCANYVRALRADPAQVIQGPSFSVATVAAAPVESGGSYVEVVGTIPARKLVDRAGRVIRELPAEGRFHFTVAALRTSNGWVVRAIRIDK